MGLRISANLCQPLGYNSVNGVVLPSKMNTVSREINTQERRVFNFKMSRFH